MQTNLGDINTGTYHSIFVKLQLNILEIKIRNLIHYMEARTL